MLKPSKPKPVSITRRAPRTVRGVELFPVTRGGKTRFVSVPPRLEDDPDYQREQAHGTIGRILMGMLDVLDMTDPAALRGLVVLLIPPSLAASEVPALCEALRVGGSAKLAKHIEEAFK